MPRLVRQLHAGSDGDAGRYHGARRRRVQLPASPCTEDDAGAGEARSRGAREFLSHVSRPAPLSPLCPQLADVFAGNIGDKKAAARLGNFQSSPFWALGQRLGGGSDPLRDEEPPRPPGAPVPSITAYTGRAATKEDGVRMLQRLIMMVRWEEARGGAGSCSPFPSSLVPQG